MSKDISILDMTPVASYRDGPVYRFSAGGFPSRGVRAAGPPSGYATPEDALAAGVKIVADYERVDPMGNMGVVLGVCQAGDRFRPVINTYHSNT